MAIPPTDFAAFLEELADRVSGAQESKLRGAAHFIRALIRSNEVLGATLAKYQAEGEKAWLEFQNASLTSVVTRLRSLLAELQWCADAGTCPVCNHFDDHGHASDCGLKAELDGRPIRK